MTTRFSPVAEGAVFSNAPVMQSAPRTKKRSAKMNESLFIVEYDGTVPWNFAKDWPFPEYEIRRKLPMKRCEGCADEIFRMAGTTLRKPRRTSWIFRKRGDYFWIRVCWSHMKPGMRDVIREMYSR